MKVRILYKKKILTADSFWSYLKFPKCFEKVFNDVFLEARAVAESHTLKTVASCVLWMPPAG